MMMMMSYYHGRSHGVGVQRKPRGTECW